MKTYFILIPVMERLTNVVFHEGMLKLANDASEDEIAMVLRKSLLEKCQMMRLMIIPKTSDRDLL